ATENSPAIHRWVKRPHFPPSPEGTTDAIVGTSPRLRRNDGLVNEVLLGGFNRLGIDVAKRIGCPLPYLRVRIIQHSPQFGQGGNCIGSQFRKASSNDHTNQFISIRDARDQRWQRIYPKMGQGISCMKSANASLSIHQLRKV